MIFLVFFHSSIIVMNCPCYIIDISSLLDVVKISSVLILMCTTFEQMTFSTSLKLNRHSMTFPHRLNWLVPNLYRLVFSSSSLVGFKIRRLEPILSPLNIILLFFLQCLVDFWLGFILIILVLNFSHGLVQNLRFNKLSYVSIRLWKST